MATNLPARFGRVIRKHRTEADWSQEELAHQAGLHRTYISLLERGLRNPSLTVMDSLAALQVGEENSNTDRRRFYNQPLEARSM